MQSQRLLFPLMAALVMTGPARAQDEAPIAPPDELAPPIVELLDAGAAPRVELRFHPKQGLRQTLEMVTETSMTMTMNGRARPLRAIPPLKMVIEFVVTDIEENGDILFNAEFTDANIVADENTDPNMAAMMRNSLKGIIGATGSAVTTNRGLPKRMSFDLPEGSDPMLQQQLEGMRQNLGQMSAPLPEEEVGRGARWKVVQEQSAHGMKIKQTATFELLSIEGDTLTIKVTMERDGQAQDINPPGRRPGALHEDSLDGAGAGMMVLRLDRITVDESEFESTMDLDLTMSNQGMEMEMQRSVNVKVRMESRTEEG